MKTIKKIFYAFGQLFRKKNKKQQHQWPEFDEKSYFSLFTQDGRDVVKANLYPDQNERLSQTME